MNARGVSCVIGCLCIIIIVGSAFAQSIVVTRSGVCSEIVDRMPVDVKDTFPAGTGRVFCYTRVDGASGQTAITHNWYHQGTLKASVVLPVRSSSWRTWSSKAVEPEWSGQWMVEVLGQDGAPLESLSFSIE